MHAYASINLKIITLLLISYMSLLASSLYSKCDLSTAENTDIKSRKIMFSFSQSEKLTSQVLYIYKTLVRLLRFDSVFIFGEESVLTLAE